MMELELLENTNPRWKKRVLVSTPTMGLVRFQWSHARYNTIIPINWEASGFDPMGFSIDDAYNLIIHKFFELKMEWLITIEDDVIIPPNFFVKMSEYINDGKVPIVSGLYYLKASPTLPLVFRGRGNSAYKDFKLGDKVWCDGIPMGCLLIHSSILKYLYDNAPEIKLFDGTIVKKVIETPRRIFFDPQNSSFSMLAGTQDLHLCDRIIDQQILLKTGWKQIARRKYPFLCDTSIFCRHIDRNTGTIYP